MFVLALRADLHLPACRSLKDRRQAIKPILDGARHRFGVAAAEVGQQDRWQRATLGFAAVAGSAGHAADVVDAVERFVWSFTEAEVLECERTWLEQP
ncbi:MAG: DUF503 domain-containing protein [Acidimicrobiales bacterium]